MKIYKDSQMSHVSTSVFFINPAEIESAPEGGPFAYHDKEFTKKMTNQELQDTYFNNGVACLVTESATMYGTCVGMGISTATGTVNVTGQNPFAATEVINVYGV